LWDRGWHLLVIINFEPGGPQIFPCGLFIAEISSGIFLLNKAASCPISDLANSQTCLQDGHIRRRHLGHRPKSIWSTNAMQITLVAVMCHVLGAVVAEGVGTIPEAVCREVVVVKQDMPMQACMLSQAALAEWKANSI
jgi:hypothetical protein